MIFTLPACGLVVAARTRQLQLRQSISEHGHWSAKPEPPVAFRCETNAEQSLGELRLKTTSLMSGKVDLIVFLFLGFVALVATVCSFAELFHLLANSGLEQTVRALVIK